MDSVGVAWPASIVALVLRAQRVLLAIITCALACSGPPPASPGAVINATPSSVCVGDAFHTQIHLDSRGSSPTLTLVYSVQDAGALTYAWAFSGVVCRHIGDDPDCTKPGYDVIVDGSSVEPDGTIDNSDVLLTVSGNVPVQVSLTVTNAANTAASVQSTISITPLDDAGACPL